MRAGLTSHSLDIAVVFHSALDGSPDDATELVLECGGADADVILISQLWEYAKLPADRGMRGIAHAPVVTRAVKVTPNARKREQVDAQAHHDHSATDQPHRSLDASLPTSLKRSRMLEGDPHAREKAEKSRRDHCLSYLRELVVAAELPIVAPSACIQEHVGPFWAWATCFVLVIECTRAMVSEISAVAAVAQLWGFSMYFAAFALAFLTIVVVLAGNYRAIETMGVTLGLSCSPSLQQCFVSGLRLAR